MAFPTPSQHSQSKDHFKFPRQTCDQRTKELLTAEPWEVKDLHSAHFSQLCNSAKNWEISISIALGKWRNLELEIHKKREESIFWKDHNCSFLKWIHLFMANLHLNIKFKEAGKDNPLKVSVQERKYSQVFSFSGRKKREIISVSKREVFFEKKNKYGNFIIFDWQSGLSCH